MQKRAIERFLKKTAIGVILSFILLGGFLGFNKNYFVGELLFYEALPFYEINGEMKAVFKGTREGDYEEEKEDDEAVIGNEDIIEDEHIIGINDIIYQDESKESIQASVINSGKQADISELKNINILKNKYYIVDKKTSMTEDLFNAEKFAAADMSIDTKGNEPKILIFHTHSKEMFADSKAGDLNEGIIGAGERLAKRLEDVYGIKCLHVTDSFDIVEGKTQIMGAYERMEPKIKSVLKENPSIEMTIDLHRDGVREGVKLVQNINGKPTAQFMLFNGISRINENGELKKISGLENLYVEDNLALSFKLQRNAEKMYPGLSRGIYLNAYRYSLHFLPKSMLIEMGAQTNTKEEIYNSVDLLANIIASVVQNEQKTEG